MAHQLLWIEVIVKLAGGLLLLLAPRLLARALGLPPAESPFWPRLLGGVLIGIAAAAFVEVKLKTGSGLGLGGAIAINLAGVACLGALLILGQGGPLRRGRAVLWLVAGVFATLALVEIAWL
ncbi:MAG: ABC transporter permease [Hyphomicrobiaceae bacterium]